VGAPEVQPRRRGLATGHGFVGSLEEEIEAQEGQGVGVRQRTTALRTDSTENASKMAASKNLLQIASLETAVWRGVG